MPHNKRESLIYTVMMCFTMVLWMSFYNVAIQMGGVHTAVFSEGWLGFPLACICAMCLDWFLVSRLAKGFAFRFLVTPESSDTKKVLAISCSMVVCMVFFMSLYGAVEGCVRSGAWDRLLLNWLINIPPQLHHGPALPAARRRAAGGALFRRLFPVGCVH